MESLASLLPSSSGKQKKKNSYFEKVCQNKCIRQSLKGIVGGFEFTVVQRNLKEGYDRPWTYVCECERKATKVGSTSIVSGTVY